MGQSIKQAGSKKILEQLVDGALPAPDCPRVLKLEAGETLMSDASMISSVSKKLPVSLRLRGASATPSALAAEAAGISDFIQKAGLTIASEHMGIGRSP